MRSWPGGQLSAGFAGRIIGVHVQVPAAAGDACARGKEAAGAAVVDPLLSGESVSF